MMHLLAAVAGHKHCPQALLKFRLYMYLVRYRRRVNRRPKIDPLLMRFLEVCFPYAISGFLLSYGGGGVDLSAFVEHRGGQ